MYDKLGSILRLEVTVNDILFFQHYRTVEQRYGITVTKRAAMKKSIYSSPALRELLLTASRRYLELLSTLDDAAAGICRLRKVGEPVREKAPAYRGLNFFSTEDQTLIETLAPGEFNLHGFQNKSLRIHLGETTSGQMSPVLKRLWLRGLVKKIPHGYRYYLTVLHKQVIASRLKLTNLVPIPEPTLTSIP